MSPRKGPPVDPILYKVPDSGERQQNKRQRLDLHEDEAQALAARAKKERASKAEIIRRALQAYLGIED